MTNEVIIVQPEPTTLVITPDVTNLEVTSPGPQGQKGDTGAQGPSGAVTNVFYTHTQNTSASVWTINHNLGQFPTLLVFDSGGGQCEGSIVYLDSNSLTVTFSSAFAGTAYVI